MASGSKGLAKKAGAEEIPASFDDVFDNESWEARLGRARTERNAVIAKREKNETTEPQGNAPQLDGGADVLSLNEVLKTGNLKERLELAQKRYSQIHESRDQKNNAPGFTFSSKSTAEFKKVVLYAKSGAKSDGETADVAKNAAVAPLVLTQASPQSGVAAPSDRRGLVVGLALLGFVASAVGVVWTLQRDPALPTADLQPVSGARDFRLSVGITQGANPLLSPVIATQSGGPELSLAALTASVDIVPPGHLVLPLSPGFQDAALLVVPLAPGSQRLAAGPSGVAFQPAIFSDPIVGFAEPGALPVWAPFAGQSDFSPDYLGIAADGFTRTGFAAPDVIRQPSISYVAQSGSWKVSPLQLFPEGGRASLAKTNLRTRSGGFPALEIPLRAALPKSIPTAFQPLELTVSAPEIQLASVDLSFGAVTQLSGQFRPAVPGVVPEARPFRRIDHGVVPTRGPAPEPFDVASLGTAEPGQGDETAVLQLAPHNIRIFAPANVPETVAGDMAVKIGLVGFDVSSIKSVGFTISSDNVRFYHRQDAETAQVLADMIGAKARDFTDFSPRPPVGTVELWLAGTASKPQKRRVLRSGVRDTSSDTSLQALRDRLAQRMQRGDHLGGG